MELRPNSYWAKELSERVVCDIHVTQWISVRNPKMIRRWVIVKNMDWVQETAWQGTIPGEPSYATIPHDRNHN